LLTKRHGYGIMQYVEEVSDGRVKLGPGTLYGGLKSMVKKKWIEELDGDNPRRRCYRLTIAGKAILEAEVMRLEELTNLGKRAVRLHSEEER
jgi:DNA-binding PadR family transcriptional regulator